MDHVQGHGRPCSPRHKDGAQMVTLTRLTGMPFALNPDLIERVDETPDTVITLVDGTRSCKPVAEFWASLSSISDPEQRAAKLEGFYFDGLPENHDRILFEQRRAEAGVRYEPNDGVNVDLARFRSLRQESNRLGGVPLFAVLAGVGCGSHGGGWAARPGRIPRSLPLHSGSPWRRWSARSRRSREPTS